MTKTALMAQMRKTAQVRTQLTYKHVPFIRTNRQENLMFLGRNFNISIYEGHPISSDNDPIKQNLFL